LISPTGVKLHDISTLSRLVVTLDKKQRKCPASR